MKQYTMRDISKEGRHEYEHPVYAELGWNKSFSVNIFKWIPKNNPAMGLKKSSCVVRVSGPVEKKEEVFELANSIVSQLNSGTWSGGKSVKIKS